MGVSVRYPAEHDAFLARCREADQTRPTPLLLRYGPGDYNCLHQDVYGEHLFPLQVAILLSEPGRDFAGGEFVLTEQRPRMQSRAEVVSPDPRRRRDLRRARAAGAGNARDLSRQSAPWCQPHQKRRTLHARNHPSRRQVTPFFDCESKEREDGVARCASAGPTSELRTLQSGKSPCPSKLAGSRRAHPFRRFYGLSDRRAAKRSARRLSTADWRKPRLSPIVSSSGMVEDGRSRMLLLNDLHLPA